MSDRNDDKVLYLDRYRRHENAPVFHAKLEDWLRQYRRGIAAAFGVPEHLLQETPRREPVLLLARCRECGCDRTVEHVDVGGQSDHLCENCGASMDPFAGPLG